MTSTCVHDKELEKIVVDEIEKQFPEHKVANLYLFGSRLHNCARPDSDFDLMVLLTGPYFVGGKLVPIDKSEANIYHADYFIDLLKQQVVWLIFIPYYPPEAKWIETINLRERVKPEYYAFGRLMRKEFDFKWRKAKHIWPTKPNTAKKLVAHMIRYCTLAKDLFKDLDHIDFSQTNDLFEEITQCKVTDWQYYVDKYMPVVDSLLRAYDAMYNVVPSFISVEQDLLFPLGQPPQYDKKLSVLEFIKLHGVDNLLPHLSVSVTRHPKYPELIQLTSDEINSPSHIFAVEECEGLILKETKTSSGKFEYEVVCYPYKAERTYKTGRISNLRVYPYHDGWRVTMYWYDDKWHLCTRNSIDASVNAKVLLRQSYNPWRIWAKSVKQAKLLEQYYKQQVEGTVAERFWAVWQRTGLELPTDKQLSYVFNLTVKETTRWQLPDREYTDNIILLGAQNIKTLEGSIPELLSVSLDWPHIHELALVRMADVVTHVRNLDPCECRGVIVVDLDSGLRYKIISKKSSLLAKFIFTSEGTDKEILETIFFNDKNDAFLSDSLAHIRPRFEKLLEIYNNCVLKIENELDATRQMTGKDLARRLRNKASSDIILTARNKGMTIKQVINSMPISTIFRNLKDLLKVAGLEIEDERHFVPTKDPNEDENPSEPRDDISDLAEYNMM